MLATKTQKTGVFPCCDLVDVDMVIGMRSEKQKEDTLNDEEWVDERKRRKEGKCCGRGRRNGRKNVIVAFKRENCSWGWVNCGEGDKTVLDLNEFKEFDEGRTMTIFCPLFFVFFFLQPTFAVELRKISMSCKRLTIHCIV